MVSWPSGGYHSSWRTYRMEKRGSNIELFRDGSSLGVKTALSLPDTEAKHLYVMGSMNGSQLSYTTHSYSENAQIDNLTFTFE